MEPFTNIGSKFANLMLTLNLELGTGPIGSVAASGRKEIKNNIDVSQVCLAFAYDSPPGGQVNLLMVPLKSLGGILGVMTIARFGTENATPFEETDYKYPELVANILALALDNIKLFELHKRQTSAEKVLEQIGLVGADLMHKVGGLAGTLAMNMLTLRSQINVDQTDAIKTISRLQRSISKLTRMNAQFRELGRPLTGSNKDMLDIKHLVDTARSEVNIPNNIVVGIEGLELPRVCADEALLTDVIEGLIRNAVEAMPNGGSFSICGSTTTDQYEIRLRFVDTGHGIPYSLHKQVFTPFFTTKEEGGLGLGLWLSKLYLESLGGEMTLASAPRIGTTFTVTLPAVPRNCLRTGSESYTSTRSGSRNSENRSDSDLVLIVEDFKEYRDALSSMLEMFHFNGSLVSNYQQAVKSINESRFRAYIVDVRLVEHDTGNFDGIEIVHQILRKGDEAPILILSAYDEAVESARRSFSYSQQVTVLYKTDLDEIEEFFSKIPE